MKKMKTYQIVFPIVMLMFMSSCGQELKNEIEDYKIEGYEAIKSNLDVSETSLSFSGESQTLQVQVVCNSYWKADINSTWLYCNNTMSKGNGTLTIQAQANPSTTSERSDIIKVTDGINTHTINVTQAPAKEVLKLSETSLQFSYNGGSSTVYVESNVNWSAVSNAEWCNIYSSSSCFIMEVQSNNSYSPRSATVTAKGASSSASITVSQSAAKEPTVGSVTVTDITKTSALCKATYSSEDLYVQTFGFCYSSSSKAPTVNDEKKYISFTNKKSGTTSISLTGLTQNTTYYVRPYVETSAGITYGQTTQFTTDKVHSPDEGDNPTPGY